MMKEKRSPIVNKNASNRKGLNKRKIEEENDSRRDSDKQESFKMAYENDNHIVFPPNSELSVKSSNTHKINTFGAKKKKSDRLNNNGIFIFNLKKDLKVLLNLNKVQGPKGKHLKKK